MKLRLLTSLLVVVFASVASAAPAETELKAVVQQWMDAYVKADTDFLEKVQAEENVAVNIDGTLFGKGQDIREVGDKTVVFKTASMTDVKVRMLGENHALVTGLIKTSGTYEKEKFTVSAREAIVFEKKDGEWRSIFSRSTEIEQPEK